MNDRLCGTGPDNGRSRLNSHPGQWLAAFALLLSTGAAAGAQPYDNPFANPIVVQPVPAAAATDDPPLVVSEPAAISDLPKVIYAAPQEAAGLGSPGKAIDPHAREMSAEGEHSPSKLLQFDPSTSDVVQVIGALAVVIGLLFLVRLVLTRASGSAAGRRPSGVVEILARYPVARGQQLILLKLARRVLLIHQNGSAMATLSEVVDEDEVAALLGRVEAGTNRKDGAFKAIFQKFSRDHDEPLAQCAAPPDQTEVIDLTRRPGSLRSLFSGKGVAR